MARRSDRRLRSRYKARIPFALRNEAEEIQGVTRNVSLLGISAYVSSSISQVQPVECRLTLPLHPKPLIARGTVIRCEPLRDAHPDGAYELGVFFQEFDGAGEADLSKYLTHLREEEQSAIWAGFRALKQRLAERRRRKRLEILQRRRKRLLRLRKRRRRETQKRRLKALRARKRTLARRRRARRDAARRRARRTRSS